MLLHTKLTMTPPKMRVTAGAMMTRTKAVKKRKTRTKAVKKKKSYGKLRKYSV